MIDLKDTTIDVNTTSELISLPVTYEELYKVTVDGVGLRIRENGTQNLPNEDIGSFTYRAFNAGAALGPNSLFELFYAGYGVGLNYFQYFRVGSGVAAGYVYRVIIDGLPVEYIAQDGDTNVDVINELVNLINTTSYSFPVTAAYSTFIADNLRIQTIGPQSITVSLEPGNFWVSKSGLYWIYNLDYYIISETRAESESIPALPAVSGPYDIGDMTNIGTDILAYLAEAEFPTVDTYDFVGFYGIAGVNNAPDTSITLASYDVLPLTGFILKFGTSFNLGFTQKLTIIYR